MIITNDTMNTSVKQCLKMRGDNLNLYALKRIEELEEQLKAIKKAQIGSLHDFINWYNEHHPANYIPNSRLGNYLQERSVS